MKEGKILIPILILTLLVACLAATFTWFSSQKEVNIGGTLDIAVNHDVILASGEGGTILPGQRPYMGEKGYYLEDGKDYGTIYKGGDAPYTFDFDTKIKAQASTNVKINFTCKYIAIKIPSKGPNGDPKYADFAKGIFEEVDPDPIPEGFANIEDYYKHRYGGAETEISVSNTDDHYYRRENNILKKYQENETIKEYAPLDAVEHKKAKEPGVLIVYPDYNHYNEKTSKIVFVIDTEKAGRYFDLTYCKIDVRNPAGDASVLPENTDVTRIYTPFGQMSTLSFLDNEVGENVEQVNTLVYNIKVRFCTVKEYPGPTNNNEGRYLPCIFGHDYFQGAKFGFSFKMSLEDM